MNIHIKKIRPALIALCIMLLTGCSLLAPVDTTTRKYVLDRIPLDLPLERTRTSSILVLAPEATPLYDTTQMVYSTHPHQVGYFSKNEWAKTPSQIMLPLIVETLRSTHYFGEVLSAPYLVKRTYTLRTEILELKHDFTSEPSMLRLTLRCYLSRDANNQVVATKQISMHEPMREKNAYAGVVAANDAMEKALRELAKFVIENAN